MSEVQTSQVRKSARSEADLNERRFAFVVGLVIGTIGFVSYIAYLIGDSETKSGFDWLCEMLRRIKCVILDHNTASYIAQSTTGEDFLLGFDLACYHLDSLLQQEEANTPEIVFFVELIRDMKSQKAVLLRRKAQAYLKEADCVMTGAKTTGSKTLRE